MKWPFELRSDPQPHTKKVNNKTMSLIFFIFIPETFLFDEISFAENMRSLINTTQRIINSVADTDAAAAIAIDKNNPNTGPNLNSASSFLV